MIDIVRQIGMAVIRFRLFGLILLSIVLGSWLADKTMELLQ